MKICFSIGIQFKNSPLSRRQDKFGNVFHTRVWLLEYFPLLIDGFRFLRVEAMRRYLLNVSEGLIYQKVRVSYIKGNICRPNFSPIV